MSAKRPTETHGRRPRIAPPPKDAWRCGACATPLGDQSGPGRPRRHCDNERCKRIYYSGHQRTKCQRCSDSLPKGREYQRLAVCMRCVVEVVDLIGLERLAPPAVQ
jgi:hypothetical protein